MHSFINWSTAWLKEQGASESIAELVVRGCLLLAVLVVAYIALAIVRVTIVRTIRKVLIATKAKWDDKLIEAGVLARASHIAPMIVIKWLGTLVLSGNVLALVWLDTFLKAYLLIIVLGVLSAFINAAQAILASTRAGANMPLKGFSQAIKLVIFLIGGILLLSILLGRSPLFFFSGLTALTAVLMLVFKDSILGFVAGIQISVNQMVRIGDWIEMPKQGADGDVIDVSLTTVKVQNWDKTISTIPTYALISESFKNWRGMSESGGRRIKRSIYVDMQTVRFADEPMLESWQKIRLLKPYLTARLAEIAEENKERGEDTGILGNGRRLTNIGTFRAYCVAYLRASPHIHQTMTFLVRHLQPTEHGLPIELYVFTSDTRWAVYEGVQADVFDHLLAIMPQFGLRVFQTPSGNDLHDVMQALARPKEVSHSPEASRQGG
ncbi:small-conductance mechanosensitive channel [Opitutaceae bacterium TAV1]|nr:small-conductance mechanosensitive channel [Opitutaceae bacterium TAV1]